MAADIQRGLAPEKVFIPSFDETFELVAGTATSKGRAAERIEDAALARDWHSEYAIFILRLAERLKATTDPNERHRLVVKLEAALES